MSRIAKKPIILPDKVKVELPSGHQVKVTGPKGELSYNLVGDIRLDIKDNKVMVNRLNDSSTSKALQGLTYRLLVNMIKGTTDGYRKELEIVGVGFRAAMQGGVLNMQLGFTHPVNFPSPEGIKIETPKPNQIVVSGIDKAKVGQAAAEIRSVFRPEPYKGKGIRYVGEFVRKKIGKAVTK